MVVRRNNAGISPQPHHHTWPCRSHTTPGLANEEDAHDIGSVKTTPIKCGFKRRNARTSGAVVIALGAVCRSTRRASTSQTACSRDCLPECGSRWNQLRWDIRRRSESCRGQRPMSQWCGAVPGVSRSSLYTHTTCFRHNTDTQLPNTSSPNPASHNIWTDASLRGHVR